MGVEVSKHIKHRLEPQMLDVALAVTIQRQTKMLRRQMGMVSVCVGGSRASYPFGTLGIVGRLRVGPIGTLWYCALLGALTLSPVWCRSFNRTRLGLGVRTSFLTLESICLFEYLFVLETSGDPEVWAVACTS